MHKKIFIKGAIYGYVHIAIYLLTGLLTTPLLLHYFSADYFAFLMLVYALITYLNHVRFGIPEYMSVFLANRTHSVFEFSIIKKALVIILLMSVISLGMIGLIMILWDDWYRVLGDVRQLDTEVVVYVFIVLVGLALMKLPFDLSLSVFIGHHDVYLEKIYKSINLVVNFLLVLYVVNYQESILFFALNAGILDLLVSLTAFLHMWIKYSINPHSVQSTQMTHRDLLRGGSLFFQLSLIQTIFWSLGIFIVSHVLTLNDVTIYSLTMKIFIYIFFFFTVILSVLAPTYGKLYTVQAFVKLQKIFDVTLVALPFFGGVIWITLVYFMSDIIFLWTGSKEYYIGHIFILIMGGIFYLMGYTHAIVTFIMSIGQLKKIIVIRWIEVVILTFFSFVLTYYYGFVGMAIGVFCALFFVSLLNLPKYIAKSTEGRIYFQVDYQVRAFFIFLLPSLIVSFIFIMFIENLWIKLAGFSVTLLFYSYFSYKNLPKTIKKEMKQFFNHSGE